jgi:hypothetical protein
MLKQQLENRNVNEYFLETEKKYIDILNEALDGIELTKAEENSLLWLCGFEMSTIKNIANVIKKAKEIQIDRK